MMRRVLGFNRSSWVGRRSTGSLAGEPRDFIYQYLMRAYVNLKIIYAQNYTEHIAMKHVPTSGDWQPGSSTCPIQAQFVAVNPAVQREVWRLGWCEGEEGVANPHAGFDTYPGNLWAQLPQKWFTWPYGIQYSYSDGGSSNCVGWRYVREPQVHIMSINLLTCCILCYCCPADSFLA